MEKEKRDDDRGRQRTRNEEWGKRLKEGVRERRKEERKPSYYIVFADLFRYFRWAKLRSDIKTPKKPAFLMTDSHNPITKTQCQGCFHNVRDAITMSGSI